MRVLGSEIHGYDGTYTNVGILDGYNAWQRDGENAYIWKSHTNGLWYLADTPAEPIDDDDAAYVRNQANGPTGTYLFWQHDFEGDATPAAQGSYDNAGAHAGYPFWQTGAPDYFLWRSAADDKYRITVSLGGDEGGEDDWWIAPEVDSIFGIFVAQGSAVGNLTNTHTAKADCEITKLT